MKKWVYIHKALWNCSAFYKIEIFGNPGQGYEIRGYLNEKFACSVALSNYETFEEAEIALHQLRGELNK